MKLDPGVKTLLESLERVSGNRRAARANGRYIRYATARVRKDRRLNIHLPIPFDG